MMTRTSTKDAAEAALRELPSVVGAYVREDIFGHPREVHILVTTGPNPRDLARDVRDLLEERLGVPVDQRVISIAQLARSPSDALPQRRIAEMPDAAAADTGVDVRLRLAGIETRVTGGRVGVSVRLLRRDEAFLGEAVEMESAAGRLRAGAAAALSAVTKALGDSGRVDLESAAVVEALGRDYALVSAHAAAPQLGRHPLTTYGAHPLRPDAAEAGACAALKATNRLVGLMLRSGVRPRAPRSR